MIDEHFVRPNGGVDAGEHEFTSSFIVHRSSFIVAFTLPPLASNELLCGTMQIG